MYGLTARGVGKLLILPQKGIRLGYKGAYFEKWCPPANETEDNMCKELQLSNDNTANTFHMKKNSLLEVHAKYFRALASTITEHLVHYHCNSCHAAAKEILDFEFFLLSQ